MSSGLAAHAECVKWCNAAYFDLEGNARNAVKGLAKEVKVGVK